MIVIYPLLLLYLLVFGNLSKRFEKEFEKEKKRIASKNQAKSLHTSGVVNGNVPVNSQQQIVFTNVQQQQSNQANNIAAHGFHGGPQQMISQQNVNQPQQVIKLISQPTIGQPQQNSVIFNQEQIQPISFQVRDQIFKEGIQGNICTISYSGEATKNQNGMIIRKGIGKQECVEGINKGDVFEGSFFEDKKNGKGRYTHANGLVYEGEFFNDAKNGRGKLIFSSGDSFEGTFRNGLRELEGVSYYGNGQKIVSNWVNDQKEGKGVIYYPNGEKEEGNWTGGQMNGIFIFSKNNGMCFERDWRNGTLVNEKPINNVHPEKEILFANPTFVNQRNSNLFPQHTSEIQGIPENVQMVRVQNGQPVVNNNSSDNTGYYEEIVQYVVVKRSDGISSGPPSINTDHAESNVQNNEGHIEHVEYVRVIEKDNNNMVYDDGS